jgi:hypothetical protein
MPADDTLDTCVSVYRASWYENTCHLYKIQISDKKQGFKAKNPK